MRKKHIITLGGYPGSGKSTVREILSRKLGYRAFSTGDFVRQLAAKRGITLEEFNDAAAQTREIDLMIDAELERIEREEDNYVVDSHLAFHFIPSGFSVFLMTTIATSAERILGDKTSPLRAESGDVMETLKEAHERTEKRIENHQERYMRHYTVDPYVPGQYAFMVDTERLTPEQVADVVLTEYQKWLGE